MSKSIIFLTYSFFFNEKDLIRRMLKDSKTRMRVYYGTNLQ